MLSEVSQQVTRVRERDLNFANLTVSNSHEKWSKFLIP